MDEITVITQDELETPAGSSDVSRKVVFETEDTVLIQSRVAGGVTTDWHHNGNRHVYGYAVQGKAVLEYGPEGKDAVELGAGEFVYVPPRTIRRVVNLTDEDWVIVLTFVGSGPPAVSVDGPHSVID